MIFPYAFVEYAFSVLDFVEPLAVHEISEDLWLDDPDLYLDCCDHLILEHLLDVTGCLDAWS